ncbi:MAG TPA: type II toxin-antitoxin system VapB family antitoxin [Cellvibrio sp.]
MRITVTIGDALYNKALELAGPDTDKNNIFREAIKTFVRVQTAKRLAALGATAPAMQSFLVTGVRRNMLKVLKIEGQ